jgi:sec-independent protein translocase protein TatC
MSDDPERDVDDEESSESPPSGSDSSADTPDEADEQPTEEEATEEETGTDESPSEDASPADEESGLSRNDEGRSDDGAADESSPDDAPEAEESGADTGDESSGEEDTTDSDESAAGSDEDAESPPDETEVPYDEGSESYVEEFVVPGMDSEEASGDTGEADQDIDLVDEDEVDESVDTAAEDEERTLPENQAGVGVDVPQQTLPEEGDDGVFGDGPESDEEMPLADHIEEMMRRLSVVFLVAGTVALTLLGLGEAFEVLPTAVELIDALWNNAIPGAPELEDRRPRLYGPLELILTKLKVTGLAGLLIGLPVFVYETYLFMRPGLYRHERRYYLAAVPTSLVLGSIGMAFAHYIIIPAIMDYFTVYTQENVASVAYGLSETFNLILVLMGYMAVVFQIPLFIMLAIMMGLVTRTWLEDKRLLFWGGFLTIAFVINPDPTGMTPFIIAATMIILYEGTLALLRWTGN